MRTGAIFARGSCRALKWMALFGVVFALTAGAAVAQPPEITVTVPDTREDAGVVSVTVEVDPNGSPADNSFEVTLTLATNSTVAQDLQGETGTDTQPLYGFGADGPADVSWEGTTRGTASPVALTFAWGDSGATQSHTVRLRTHRDPDAEDENFTVTASSSDTDNGTVVDDSDGFKVTDVETQTYVLRRLLSPVGDVEIDEGDDEEFELEAVPLKTDAVQVRVTLDSENDDSDYSLNPTVTASISENFTIPAASGTGQTGGTVPVPFTTQDNDRDRIDDTVTLTAYWLTPADRRGDEATSLTVMVIDQHKLPPVTLSGIQVPDADDKLQNATSIPEGTIGTVTLVADRGTSTDDVPDTEDITVTLTHVDSSTAARADYTLAGSPVAIDAATGTRGTGTFTIDVDADEDVGMESLVLLATVAGDDDFGPNPDPPYNLAAIDFGDQTEKQIEAKTYADIMAAVEAARTVGAGSNGLWEPGEMLTLEASDLFTYAATASVVLGNIVIDDTTVLGAATTNDMVTITALGDGDSPISITGSVVGPSSLEVTQTVSNVVTVKFPIAVDAPAITAKDNVQAVATAAVAAAAAASANGIWEPAPNGAVAMVAVSDLFDVPASINAEYLSRSSDNADVMAAVSSDMMNVELTPMGAGPATITVTAVDTDRPGNAVSVEFDVTVMSQASIRALSQAEVDAVFEAVGRRRPGGAGTGDQPRHGRPVRAGLRRDARLLGDVQ